MEKQIRTFDKEYLNILLICDGAVCISHDEKLHGGSNITFRCTCGTETIKKFRDIAYYAGAFCKSCVTKRKVEKIKDKCLEKYGVENPSQCEEIKKKKDATYMEHYGMHPKKTSEVNEKYKKTCIERYNVDNTSKLKEVKDKIKLVFEEKYGGHPMLNEIIKNKVRDTCMERYGGYPAENLTVKKKIEETFINNYGCYPLQDKSILQKHQETSRKYRKYTMPSGAVRLIQGYEHFAIESLLKLYSEEQIISERNLIPRFKYTINEKNKYYFPDIYLPEKKTIIEVKSDYTFLKDKEKLEKVKPIIESEGYDYEIWIFDRKGNRI